MSDAQPAEFLLDGYPPAIRETGRALRTLILRTVPGTVETVRPGWRWIAYSLPDGRRVRNFAWIGPERKHIHLGFEHGTLLADPDRVLHGAEERLKKFRYFTFEPAIDVDEASSSTSSGGRRTSRRCRRRPGGRSPRRRPSRWISPGEAPPPTSRSSWSTAERAECSRRQPPPVSAVRTRKPSALPRQRRRSSRAPRRRRT